MVTQFIKKHSVIKKIYLLGRFYENTVIRYGINRFECEWNISIAPKRTWVKESLDRIFDIRKRNT